MDELGEHATVDEHVRSCRQPLAVDVGGGVGQRIGGVVDERDGLVGNLLAQAIAEQAASLDGALTVQRRADDRQELRRDEGASTTVTRLLGGLVAPSSQVARVTASPAATGVRARRDAVRH